MKTTKKFGLKKQTIANLSEIHLAGIKGGSVEEDNTARPENGPSIGLRSCWEICIIVDTMTNPD